MLLVYLLPYLLLLLLAYINISINTKASNLLVALALFLFAALRYDVGYDYMNYYEVVKIEQIFNMEFFEALIIQLSHNLKSPQLFFVINFFITMLCVFWGLKRKSANIAISLFSFLCLPLLYLHSFSIIRFWTALSIVFLASTYLLDKKYVHFCLLNAVAIGFHYAAIVGFLFLIIKFVKINKLWNVLILLCSIVLSAILQRYLSNFAEVDNVFAMSFLDYANADEGVSGFTRLPYVFLLFDIIFLFGTVKLQRQYPELEQYTTIYNLGCCIMFLLNFQPTLSSRLSRFFLIYILLIVPYIIQGRTKIPRAEKKLVLFFVCVSLYIFILTIFNQSLHRYEYLPYQVFF